MMMTAVMTMLWRLHSGCWREREALRRGGGRWDGGWRRWRRRRWGAAAPAHHWSPPPAVGRWGPTWELATTHMLYLVFPLFHLNSYCPPTEYLTSTHKSSQPYLSPNWPTNKSHHLPPGAGPIPCSRWEAPADKIALLRDWKIPPCSLTILYYLLKRPWRFKIAIPPKFDLK